MSQFSVDDKRIAKRHRTRLAVSVRAGFIEHEGVVVDLSQNGLCVATTTVHGFRPGQSVEIRCNELGYVFGTVRWATMRRAGIQFDMNSNTSAKVTSFFKYFHG